MNIKLARIPASLTSLLISACLALPAFAQDNVESSAASKNYSPYVDRDYPTRVYFGDTHHHTPCSQWRCFCN